MMPRKKQAEIYPVTIQIPKAELHVHLEGAVRPALIRQIAEKRGVVLPEALMSTDDRVRWKDFSEFHVIYDGIAGVLLKEEDFYTITYDYLKNLVAANALYGEIIISPYVAKANGLSYEAMQAGVVAAAKDIEKNDGLKARFLLAVHRHEGPEAAEKIIKPALAARHDYIVGANITGDTVQYALSDFKELCHLVKKADLGLSVHAGESTGPDEIIEALDVLGADRIGHGVRAIEDEKVLARVIKEQVMLEVCPTSNIVLDFYKGYEHHPLHQLKKLGANISLNSDDPTFFGAWLADEYQVAHDRFGYRDDELKALTKNALAAAFI